MSKPSADEQYMLELVNRMRQVPVSELNLLLNSPSSEVREALSYFDVDRKILEEQWRDLKAVAPVAWSEKLQDSARTHNELMVYYDRQSHNLPNEPRLLDRIEKTGYEAAKVAENIFAYPESVFAGHAGFAIDWGNTETGIQNPPGHRITLLNEDYRELGISIIEENDPNTTVGSLLITQHFGLDRQAARSNADPWLLGVVYDDSRRNDNFYTPGEGLEAVTVEVKNRETGETYQTQSWRSGGYQLQLPAGTYTATFKGDFDRDGRNDTVSQRIAVRDENIKLDLITDSLDLSTSVAATLESVDDSIDDGEPSNSNTQTANSHGEIAFDRELTLSLTPFSGRSVSGDWLEGHSGSDTLLGSDIDDALEGNAGNDVLVGRSDRDRLDGNEGDDSIFGNTGRDTLDGGLDNDDLYGGREDDLIVSGGGNDAVMGDFGEDTVTGDSGHDLLYGNAGDDLIDGGFDNDTLFGGLGDDTLFGGPGDDDLVGDRGNDLLVGGEGRDRFWVKPEAETLTIADFSDDVDRIVVSDGLEYQDFTVFEVGNDLQLVAGHLSLTLQNCDRLQLDETDFLSV
ncbi:CAP domain-containing protein [Geitlerinema sp. CS-897]|nr:CAP domain-containing protein [Geitlerinema sp. CS-897]